MSILTVSIIQSTLHWEDKAANLNMFEEKINQLPAETELVVLPEMFSTGFTMQPQKFAETMEGETMEWLKRVSRTNKVIITGSIVVVEKGNYFNRLIWMLPNEQYGYYDKRHLFAFAEEDQHYTAGNKRLIASVKGWKINLQICYDLRFPVWARQSPQSDSSENESAQPEYDVLIYVANWPERRSIAWKTLLVARAIENQCYVIGLNRVGNDGNNIYHSGDSMIIDPMGEVLAYHKDIEDISTIRLQKDHLNSVREKFPFWKDGDGFKILKEE
jgi:omega-amidase